MTTEESAFAKGCAATMALAIGLVVSLIDWRLGVMAAGSILFMFYMAEVM